MSPFLLHSAADRRRCRLAGPLRRHPQGHRQPPRRPATGSLRATQGETAAERLCTPAQAPRPGTRRLFEALTRWPRPHGEAPDCTFLVNAALPPRGSSVRMPVAHAKTVRTAGSQPADHLAPGRCNTVPSPRPETDGVTGDRMEVPFGCVLFLFSRQLKESKSACQYFDMTDRLVTPCCPGVSATESAWRPRAIVREVAGLAS